MANSAQGPPPQSNAYGNSPHFTGQGPNYGMEGEPSMAHPAQGGFPHPNTYGLDDAGADYGIGGQPPMAHTTPQGPPPQSNAYGYPPHTAAAGANYGTGGQPSMDHMTPQEQQHDTYANLPGSFPEFGQNYAMGGQTSAAYPAQGPAQQATPYNEQVYPDINDDMTTAGTSYEDDFASEFNEPSDQQFGQRGPQFAQSDNHRQRNDRRQPRPRTRQRASATRAQSPMSSGEYTPEGSSVEDSEFSSAYDDYEESSATTAGMLNDEESVEDESPSSPRKNGGRGTRWSKRSHEGSSSTHHRDGRRQYKPGRTGTVPETNGRVPREHRSNAARQGRHSYKKLPKLC